MVEQCSSIFFILREDQKIPFRSEKNTKKPSSKQKLKSTAGVALATVRTL
jgi:hypothetical protein